MASVQNPQTLASDATTLLNIGGSNSGPDGLVFSITVTGTNSLVLYKNTAPPGAAVSLTSIPYQNAALAVQSAGTAITASGLAYVTPEDASFDLYGTLNWTSGAVVIGAATASKGGGGGTGGDIPAGDVTPGTFGSNSGSTGDYTFPDDLVVSDDADVVGDLTAGTIASDAGITGTTLALTAGSAQAIVATSTNANQVTVAYDASNKLDIAVSSAGAVTLNATGASAGFAFPDLVTASSGLRIPNAIDLALRDVAGTGNAGTLSATAANNLSLNNTTSAANVQVAVTTGGAIQHVINSTVVADTSASGQTLGTAASAAASVTRSKKATTGIADNVATTVCTITVPNAAHSAVIKLTALGVLGAGGDIGAGEANASNSYDITIVRTAGVNAVADISTAYGVNAANVAGAATCTAAVTVGAVSGAVGATNTFAVQITIVKSGGASDNHTALVRWEIINQNAAGISVA